MRKICVVTSNRAEYGIMSRLIEKIEFDSKLELQLIVTGSHLSDKFGKTYKEITSPITKEINIEIEKDPSHSMAIAIEKFSQVFVELKPDLLLILGDRYEIMAVTIAAMLNNLPIAHLYGGESTQGAIDEAIRHSITKMSHIHFASCEEYKNRIIQLGEKPESVFNVGALGVENIEKIKLLDKKTIEQELSFEFGEKNLLVTFHPVTLEKTSSKEQFKELLNALDNLENTKIIFTKPNSDKGNQDIIDLIDEYVKNNANTIAFKSMGTFKYLSALQFMDGVVGNSSSGIIEVPSLKKGTINIGDRQKGRIQAKSIINCIPEKTEIIKALNLLFSNEFKESIKDLKNPYQQEKTSDSIIKILKSYNLDNILKKSFYDLKVT